MNAVECSHLSRSFGRTAALKDISFSVPAGSFFALLGPNGAGKSTTLKILLNLLKPSSGGASVLGKLSTDIGAADFQNIGYIAEGQEMPEWMTGAQFLAYCRSLYTRWDDALAQRLGRDFRVPMDRKIRQMSRGQRMQIALLSTLPFRPELLVLDEPFSGLDPLVRDDLIQGLLELPNDDRPKTLIISSHDIDEVERLTDEVAFLAESHLLIRESTEVLHSRFRRVEIVSISPLAEIKGEHVLEFRQPAPNVLQFVVDHHSPATEAIIRGAHPGASVSFRPMTLREIFVVVSRQERLSRAFAS